MKNIFFLCLTICAIPCVAQVTINPILPFDGDTIQTKNPCISWLTNGIINPNDGRTFIRLILVELNPSQSAQAGIVVNIPKLKMDNLNASQIFYPFDAPELEFEKRYGWQIQAIQNNITLASSEAWEFTLHQPVPKFSKFATLKLFSDGSDYLAEGGKLFFILDDDYKSEQLNIQIFDNEKNIVSTSANKENVLEQKEGANAIALGNNYYEMNIGSFCKLGTYQLVITNTKKQKFLLDFTVK
jgi:hypothetical protein